MNNDFLYRRGEVKEIRCTGGDKPFAQCEVSRDDRRKVDFIIYLPLEDILNICPPIDEAPEFLSADQIQYLLNNNINNRLPAETDDVSKNTYKDGGHDVSSYTFIFHLFNEMMIINTPIMDRKKIYNVSSVFRESNIDDITEDRYSKKSIIKSTEDKPNNNIMNVNSSFSVMGEKEEDRKSLNIINENSENMINSNNNSNILNGDNDYSELYDDNDRTIDIINDFNNRQQNINNFSVMGKNEEDRKSLNIINENSENMINSNNNSNILNGDDDNHQQYSERYDDNDRTIDIINNFNNRQQNINNFSVMGEKKEEDRKSLNIINENSENMIINNSDDNFNLFNGNDVNTTLIQQLNKVDEINNNDNFNLFNGNDVDTTLIQPLNKVDEINNKSSKNSEKINDKAECNQNKNFVYQKKKIITKPNLKFNKMSPHLRSESINFNDLNLNKNNNVGKDNKHVRIKSTISTIYSKKNIINNNFNSKNLEDEKKDKKNQNNLK